MSQLGGPALYLAVSAAKVAFPAVWLLFTAVQSDRFGIGPIAQAKGVSWILRVLGIGLLKGTHLSYAVSVHEACAHRDDRDLDDGYGPGRAQKRKKDAYAEHRQAGKVQPLWAHFPLHEDEPQRNQAQRRPPAQKQTDGGGDPLTRLADCHFHSGGERNDARGEHLLPLGDEEAESDAVGRVAGFAGD